MDNKELGVSFANMLNYTEELNTYTYRNFYNGGGVGIGDFNNDGLKDVYLTGNLERNHLYVNKGKWKFEEVAISSGVACEDIWSTGVSIADVNGDGWLDIYVCKSGPPGGDNRSNELFINNKDMTFTEQASAMGLDDLGLSTHAAFFDMDKDGDLDCYLLNNSLRSVGGYNLKKDQREVRDTLGGNRLYRNDHNHFVDVSEKAGIYGSSIGFGLGVTIGDVNGDNWPDIYVSNDYFEKDYIYINQKNGSFEERGHDYLTEMSLSSMGADMADLNNDGYPEIFVTDMLPKIERRIKTKTTFDNWDKYSRQERQGYGRQFTRNALQLNNRDGTFSEVSRMTGVNATDWSWGALIFDMNNDGLKDIFVANGLYKDLTDQDYTNFIGSPENIRGLIKNGKEVIKTLIDSIPSEAIANAAFMNNGNMSFVEMAQEIGLGTPSFSNGAAYGDLDNDGDLDLVINNVNSPASFFKNQTESLLPQHHYMKIVLEGNGANSKAINTKVELYQSDVMQYQELMPMRSYMSTTDDIIHFGVGTATQVDSVIVIWPDGGVNCYYDLLVDSTYIFYQDSSTLSDIIRPSTTATQMIFRKNNSLFDRTYVHEENEWSDFDRELLLTQMTSNEGPCMCSGDLDNDGDEDLYIGGSKGQPGSLYLNTEEGFVLQYHKTLERDSISEDRACAFIDVNGDDQLDLYVGSGGNELPSSSAALSDRLYIRKGRTFVSSRQSLPGSTYASTATVVAADYDDDGDQDLFVGIRQKPFQYGTPVSGYILKNNNNGTLQNVTRDVAPELIDIGMITDASWADVDGDMDLDLVVIGEWMEVSIFINDRDGFNIKKDAFQVSTSGLYKTIETADIDKDGDQDFIIGNKGANTSYHASRDHPMKLYVNDFDNNGTIEHIVTQSNDGHDYPIVLLPELVKQLPSLKSKFLKHRDYAGKRIGDIFSEDVIQKSRQSNVVELSHIILLNDGSGHFTIEYLPRECQMSSIYAIDIDDYDGDGNIEILYGGNQYRSKPQLGIDGASYMGVVKIQSNGDFDFLNSLVTGVLERGEVRDIVKIKSMNKRLVLIAKNNDKLKTYEY